MPRTLHRLSLFKIRTIKKPGLFADGGGLYLQVKEGIDRINKSWIFRFANSDGERQMGLGSCDTISLAEAREAALQCRKLRQQGLDPIEARRTDRAKDALAAARLMTFDQCSDAFIAAKQAGWHSLEHASQWRNSLSTYVSPVFGKVSVASVDTALVIKALKPLWTTKPETAKRVRGRIEAILDWAKAAGYRDGENPARFRGHLKHLLADVPKKVKHLEALPYGQMTTFMAQLRSLEGIPARALEFTILTAARSGDVIGARWNEIKDDVWTVPPERMKSSREHRVPLSPAALAIVEQMRRLRDNEFVFPGERAVKINRMAMELILRRMEHKVTVHGFRSAFKDWASDCTEFATEVSEAALAHAVGDKVEAAYRRGDLFEKRRRLMEAWAEYCAGRLAGGVVALLTRDAP